MFIKPRSVALWDAFVLRTIFVWTIINFCQNISYIYIFMDSFMFCRMLFHDLISSHSNVSIFFNFGVALVQFKVHMNSERTTIILIFFRRLFL